MCGVFGVHGHPESARVTCLGLHALQHRGQESAGVVVRGGGVLSAARWMGLVRGSQAGDAALALVGSSAIGHVRYATAGDSNLANAQPLLGEHWAGSVAIAHNGNLTNARALRLELESSGAVFRSNADTEVIVHLLARSRAATLAERAADALRKVEGAYSLLLLDANELVAVRDPHGFRPLCLGRLERSLGGGDVRDVNEAVHVVASESAALELVGAVFVRDIEPGEMVTIDASGVRSTRPFAPAPRRACLFEHVYFARPDSVLEGRSVYEVRKRCGEHLIEEHPVEGASREDAVVVPVPDSGVAAALGLAERAGLPFELGLARSHEVGRTFLAPRETIRSVRVREKLSPVAAALAGKRVIVVDDSIVRGTTSREVVRMLRHAGAREVHVRIASPPTAWPCFYGIDTPTRSELLAARHDAESIRRELGADSLGYLSLAGLEAAVRGARGALDAGNAAPDSRACHACFSGIYPVPVGVRGG